MKLMITRDLYDFLGNELIELFKRKTCEQYYNSLNSIPLMNSLVIVPEKYYEEFEKACETYGRLVKNKNDQNELEELRKLKASLDNIKEVLKLETK